MRVLNLLQADVISKLPYYIGACLGEGADGEIREMPSHPTKLIKLSIIYDLDYSKSLFNQYKSLNDLFNKIQKDNHSCFVKLHDHGLLHNGKRQTALGEQDYIIHYSVMEKLFKISEDESKVFHTILSHEDCGKIKNYSEEEIRKILNNFRRGLDFSENEIILFSNQLRKINYSHNDICPRNIMKNRLGQFKLIDLDRIKINE